MYNVRNIICNMYNVYYYVYCIHDEIYYKELAYGIRESEKSIIYHLEAVDAGKLAV